MGRDQGPYSYPWGELDQYQDQATATISFPQDKWLEYTILGLTGEAGEIANKYKKIIRDKGGVVGPEDVAALRKEAGDVLWYLAIFLLGLDVRLSDTARENLHRLADRKERGKIAGSGDNR